MNKWRKIVGAAFMTSALCMAWAATAYADVIEEYDTTSTANWSGNGNQIFDFRSEENGNQYMTVSYQSNNAINYYEVWRDFDSLSGDVVLTFDIKFSDHMTDNIFLRKRASGVWDAGVRIFKDWTHINYYSNGIMYRLIQSDISYSKWYTFEISMSTLNGGTQSIVAKERDSGAIVGHVDNIPLNIAVDSVNQFVLGSDGIMCLDNLRIYKPNIQTIAVTGESYPVIGRSYTYSAKAKDSNGLEFNVPIQWSLKDMVEGVSIDADTGVLTIASTANVGRAVIVATDKNNTSKKAYYLIDIER